MTEEKKCVDCEGKRKEEKYPGKSETSRIYLIFYQIKENACIPSYF